MKCVFTSRKFIGRVSKIQTYYMTNHFKVNSLMFVRLYGKKNQKPSFQQLSYDNQQADPSWAEKPGLNKMVPLVMRLEYPVKKLFSGKWSLDLEISPNQHDHLI